MWEKIDDEILRLELPNGWLVKMLFTFGGVRNSATSTSNLLYIEDKEKLWILK